MIPGSTKPIVLSTSDAPLFLPCLQICVLASSVIASSCAFSIRQTSLSPSLRLTSVSTDGVRTTMQRPQVSHSASRQCCRYYLQVCLAVKHSFFENAHLIQPCFLYVMRRHKWVVEVNECTPRVSSMWRVTSKSRRRCGGWTEPIGGLQDKCAEWIESDHYHGVCQSWFGVPQLPDFSGDHIPRTPCKGSDREVQHAEPADGPTHTRCKLADQGVTGQDTR
jgi:hypothetical protein